MKKDEKRNQLINIIKREFIGPDPVEMEGMIQENGEEILTSDPPRIRYSAGILFPRGIMPSVTQDTEEHDEDGNENYAERGDEGIETQDDNKNSGAIELLEETEEIMNLSNAFHQSAISFTASVKNGDEIRARVNAGIYITVKSIDPITKKALQKYYRKQIIWDNDGIPLPLPSKLNKIVKYNVVSNGKETDLKFDISYRYDDSKNNCSVYTFSLENSKKIGDASIKDDDCYFQTEFHILSKKGFSSLPEQTKININDEDYDSNQLLYRNVKNYAIGHGCSAEWIEDQDRVIEIYSTIIPTYEIKPIIPSKLPRIKLEMYNMSDFGDFNGTLKELTEMCEQYLTWINNLRTESLSLDKHYRATAERHIRNCTLCYERMIDGLNLLISDDDIRKAFQYMNRAMLLQQLHYNLPLQEWKDDGGGGMKLNKTIGQMPDINNPSTWYDRDNRTYGIWRPFQIAFILMNLRSMTDKTSKDRKIVDLIWFPTGGGKTEAYLGLSAFTIFIRKLKSLDDKGTAILMRYTLRLLTAQQYERASSMICACEIIRKENKSELGNNRISIGLWVGGDTTPNKMNGGDKSAVKLYESLYKGSSEENPFIILKCPWCGAKMGVVQLNDKTRRIAGYHKTTGRKKEIIFQCDNSECEFSKDDFFLPLAVVDEVIYEEPPTLLLGTVDKFAMLPYRPEAQKIFGIYEGERITSLDLIIQDELHLISGPLGSMVGHYETLINELCTDREKGIEMKPKVIASTATISRAKEQCNALYNCSDDNVIQFPPSGIDAGDSFFALEDKQSVGRMYVGVFAPASSSFAMTNIRLYATLLYAAKALDVNNETERDPYWTNLGYYNSLRELGQTATWVNADIDEYLHTIYKRRYEDKAQDYKEKRRYIWRFEELTSRIRSDKIPLSLQNLNIAYEGDTADKHAVDICLATNMVSVGVDIPRLGLMTVVGQPKTTSEYIQATSRVGRSPRAPGIVFITYNPGRPRDKSHYEHFISYHSRIYSHVEPTSVTPFSSPLRERALHAILIGMIRLLSNSDKYMDPKKVPSDDELERLFQIIERRVQSVDQEELDNTKKHLREIVKEWKIQMPQVYQDFSASDVVPLMYPAGSMPNAEWEGRGMPTPTSMRNVDASCEAYVLQNEYTMEE